MVFSLKMGTHQFSTQLPTQTIKRLHNRFRTGIRLWRGIYYSDDKRRVKNYGELYQFSIVLQNPLILTDEEAYTQIADRFGTISGFAGEPQHGSGDFSNRSLRAAKARHDVIKNADGINTAISASN